MTGLSSKTILNMLIILFSVLTIFTLKNDVIGFFKNYSKKEVLIKQTSQTISDKNDLEKLLCEPPSDKQYSDIEEEWGRLEDLYENIKTIQTELEKPYAPYSATYKNDLKYYNEQVSSYNESKNILDGEIEKYNNQLEFWNSCK